MKFEFEISGELFEWRGPSPFHFVRVSKSDSDSIKTEASILSYGWGVIPINGKVGNTNFTTSLIPKDGQYLVPIKDSVRLTEELVLGDIVNVLFNLGKIKSN